MENSEAVQDNFPIQDYTYIPVQGPLVTTLKSQATRKQPTEAITAFVAFLANACFVQAHYKDRNVCSWRINVLLWKDKSLQLIILIVQWEL